MKTWKLCRLGIYLAVVALFAAWGASARGGTITVKNTLDSPTASCFPGETSCTLREAIKFANLVPGEDTVIVPAGLYGLSIEGPGEDVAASGDLDVTDDLILLGAGMDETTIDGLGLDRVFDIRGDISVTIHGVTITGGVDDTGGGINVDGAQQLVLQYTRVTGNRADTGSGLYANPVDAVLIRDSEFRGNTILPESTFRGNSIEINYASSFVLYRSTVAENHCTHYTPCAADGIRLQRCKPGTIAQIENSTVRSLGAIGLAIFNCSAAIRHSTIADSYGGLRFNGFDNSYTLTLRSTIIADNHGFDCNWSSGGIIDSAGGFNLDSDGTCGLNASLGDLPDTDPQLGPFGNYTSPTPSYHPQPGSPVIDAAASCATTMDQDRFERPDGDQTGGGLCDLGSIEVLPCGDGSPSIILLPGVYSSGSWEACDALKAIGVEVAAGSILRFSARGSITLVNFKVPAGSTFSAAIERTADWNP